MFEVFMGNFDLVNMSFVYLYLKTEKKLHTRNTEYMEKSKNENLYALHSTYMKLQITTVLYLITN